MTSETSALGPEKGQPLRLSCLTCRSRKMKCDRTRPICTRCSRSGVVCEFPATRKRPVVLAARPKVKDLTAKLAHLEKQLKVEQDKAESQSPNLDDFALVDTGRFEQSPPFDIVEDLTTTFFSRIHSETPIINQDRYIASLYMPPHMQPPMCLQYILMAQAATISPVHKQLAEPFYRRARRYAEEDEMKADGEHFITLAHAQCWIIISHFEAQHLWFGRANMSSSKATRLVQMLGLDKMDAPKTHIHTLPAARDWCEMEERRRTLWLIFVNDRGASSTAGWPTLFNHRRIKTLLPASDSAFSLGVEEPSVTLRQALSNETPHLSTFACHIMAAHLLQQSMELGGPSYAHDDDAETKADFWKRYGEVDRGLTVTLLNLPSSLESHASLARLSLHIASICLHRAGSARMKQHGAAEANLLRSWDRVMPAAEDIFATVALAHDIEARFRNLITGFASFMAATVFLEDFVASRNQASEEKLTALLDIMISVGTGSSSTASLAMRLAHKVFRHGIDPLALEKIRCLWDKIDPDAPLLGASDDDTGSVTFCPLSSKDAEDPGTVFANVNQRAR